MIAALLTALLTAPTSVAGCPAEMLEVPGGTLEREGAESIEVAPFCLDRTEVTVERYGECVARGACTASPGTVAGPDLPERHVPLWSRSCNAGRKGREAHPINCIDWRQAHTFCEAHGVRLPSEWEWEWAATGGDERRLYPWGGLPPSARLLNACDFLCLDRMRKFGMARRTLHYGEDGFEDTAPVRSFPDGAARWGHHDLAGNTWEFTSTRFATEDGVRVIRGGGWAQTDASRVRADYRGGYLTTARGSAVGFRCARDLP